MNSSIRSTFRRNISKGPIKKTIVTKNQRVVDVKFWGMINCTDNTENKLKKKYSSFSNLASNQLYNKHILYLCKILEVFKPLLDQIMHCRQDNTSNGRILGKIRCLFWRNRVIHLESMNEIFQDDIIILLSESFGQLVDFLPSMWSAEMNLFAFGHP
jgi:hypothetical protein